MSVSISRFTRAVSAVATATLVLSGISLVMVAPANAAPVTVSVTGNDIASYESAATYVGWHEGYNNATRAYFVDSSGLHLGVGSVHSQILNGSAPEPVAPGVLQSRITSAEVVSTTGIATFQLPLFFGPGQTQDYTTLYPTNTITGTNTFATSDNWISSRNIPNTGTAVITKDVPTQLSTILAALEAQGSLRLLGFGVQADAPAVVTSVTYNGTVYQFVPYVAAAPSNQVLVPDADVKSSETPSTYKFWHEGKNVDSSTVKTDGLYLGSPDSSTVIKGSEVYDTAPLGNPTTRVTQAQLQELIAKASVDVASGSVTFQIPVLFSNTTQLVAGQFTTLRSLNVASGTHTFSLADTWATSRAWGAYAAQGEVVLGDMLDTLFKSYTYVWVAGFGVQADTLSVVPSLVWDGTEYLFKQPVTQVCTSVATGPIATNQNSQGWTFGQTRATGHNDFTADGLHVWTESNTSTDKAAGYKAVNFPLADVGSEPEINLINTTGGLPSLQLGISLNGDGVWNGYIVNEGDLYGHGMWWTNKTGFGVAPGGGYPSLGTINDYLLANPRATVISIGYSLGSGVLGSATITSIVAGCTSYGFTANDTYTAPTTTVNVNDSEIFPIENYVGWGDGYGYTPRSYFTQADGAHIGNGHATQLFQTFATPLSTTDLESLITGASVSVGSGSATYQVAITYGNANTFTTLRSNSLTAPSNHFSVTDKWVSTRALVDNVNGTVTSANYEAPIADLVAFLNSQGNVRVLGMGAQADSPAVVQDIVFNGTKYHFVPTAADTSGQTDVRVTQPEIDLNEALDGSNYTDWHQGYPGQEADPTFAVGDAGLILTPANDPVTPRSQILKGLTTPVAGADLYALLTSHAGITVGAGGDVTYQVPVTFNGGWSTLRSASLSTGAHTFSLSDLWISSKNIGSTITGGVQYSLGDILDALNAQGAAEAIGFGVQTTVPAVVKDITWGNTRYYFDGAIVAATPTITGGSTFGDTLTAVPGAWTPSNVTLSYQWRADSNDISGATSSTYTPTADMVGATITVVVTGSAPNYAPVSSLPSLGVTIAPATLTTAVPTISGNPLVGQTLTADAGAWSPGTVALTYQWYADNVAITSATGSTYILTGAENGKTITVTVTGTLAGYTTASETSAGFGPIGLPQIQAGTPEILGSAFVGGSLSVDTHDDTWTPTSGLTYGYVWKADGSPISGATSPTFTVTDNEIGKTITVTVTGSATDYISASATSGGVGPVASPVIVAATPTISGTPTVDQVLTADAHAAGWTPATGLTFTYVWKADGTTISGATMSTYTLTAAEAGAVITVTVTGSKLNYVSGSATSDPTAAVAKGTITPATPTLTGTGKIGQPLNVDLHSADWAPSGVALTYVWKANGATISGATSLSYTPTASDLGKTIVVTATGTLAGYTTAMKTSLGVTVINGTLVVSRLAGVDRYETSVKISEKWNTATKVYIANGLGYADALSAGPAAAHFHAPLLLTAPASLPPVVVTELNRLHPTEIVIVGGVGAVSAAVENALNALSFHPLVTRVAGIDRYATSRALAIDTWGPGSLGTAYLATGTDFPDALSAAPAAAHFGGPVVLIPGMASSVDTATLNLLTYLGVDKIKIAGGAGVVSAAIEAQVRTIFGTGNVTRNGGIDRYATSVAINADEFTSASTVYLAQGMGFPDALAGAAIAGNNGAPLFVSQATCIPQSVLDAISHLGATSLVLLGGTGVLSPAVESLTSCGPTS